MLKLDFILIGAQKAGTTTLDSWMAQHPEIYLPPQKELNFFALEGKKPDWPGPGDDVAVDGSVGNRADYESIFESAGDAKVNGESSVLYLYSERAPVAIHREFPEARFIVSLRNPIDRAYSAFGHLRRDGREPEADFSKALELEELRISKGWEPLWHYRAMGFYGRQLVHWLSYFDRSQFFIVHNSQLRRNPDTAIREIFRFIGVDSVFRPNLSIESNSSGISRNQQLNDFLNLPHGFKSILKKIVPLRFGRRVKTLIQKNNLQRLAAMPEELRVQLTKEYAEDQALVEEQVGYDLPPVSR
ncbi:MAG: sulfotransferase [Deltaproteobacteria bacterium]|jgi:hypothetical protein|nr:sulfotransferase [Deltaproteobacteria bacterium]